MSRAIAVQIGSRWAAVTDYGDHGGTGERSGYWCEDAAGGAGVSRRSARAAVDECVRPSLYRSKRAAFAAVDPLDEMDHATVESEPSVAAVLGARGGAAGTGEAKRRGGSDHYREMAKRSAAARKKA